MEGLTEESSYFSGCALAPLQSCSIRPGGSVWCSSGSENATCSLAELQAGSTRAPGPLGWGKKCCELLQLFLQNKSIHTFQDLCDVQKSAELWSSVSSLSRVPQQCLFSFGVEDAACLCTAETPKQGVCVLPSQHCSGLERRWLKLVTSG